MHTSAASKQYRSTTPQGFNKFAPTGIQRTWKWGKLTNEGYDENHVLKPRIPLKSKPPPECTNPTCEYYGDWLDAQGLWTYCLSKEHKKLECAKYAQAVARFPKNASSNAIQGNSTAPAPWGSRQVQNYNNVPCLNISKTLNSSLGREAVKMTRVRNVSRTRLHHHHSLFHFPNLLLLCDQNRGWKHP